MFGSDTTLSAGSLKYPVYTRYLSDLSEAVPVLYSTSHETFVIDVSLSLFISILMYFSALLIYESLSFVSVTMSESVTEFFGAKFSAARFSSALLSYLFNSHESTAFLLESTLLICGSSLIFASLTSPMSLPAFLSSLLSVFLYLSAAIVTTASYVIP